MSSKPFDFNSVINPLARRSGLIELRGHRIALPGVVSPEPLLRGCNQREWLDRLLELGIRHLVVPLNGAEEDTCLFARRHPRWDFTPGPEDAEPACRASQVLYDLAHRDEGVFTRLQFLLDAADTLGVMVGLSLFSLGQSAQAGPLRPHGNLQSISLSGDDTGKPIAEIEATLAGAADWIAAEVRGRTAVWVEIFRERELPRNALLKRLEKSLSRRIGEALGKPGDDAKKRQGGPWVLPPLEPNSSEVYGNRTAPFLSWRGPALSAFSAGQKRAGGPRRDTRVLAQKTPTAQSSMTHDPETEERISEGLQSGELIKNELQIGSFHEDPRRPAIHEYPANPAPAPAMESAEERAWLWRSAMRGYWPIVPGGFGDERDLKRWSHLTQLAIFAKQWVTYGYLRACPELLIPMEMETRAAVRVREQKITAATDGCGRYFVYFHGHRGEGLELETPPGTYRYYWFDPATGQGLDRGEGLDGGTRCRVPAPGDSTEAVLVLEQEELPDPFSVW